jgi:hypothetical protein
MPESGKPDMNISSKARGFVDRERPPRRQTRPADTLFFNGEHCVDGMKPCRPGLCLCLSVYHGNVVKPPAHPHPGSDPFTLRLPGATGQHVADYPLRSRLRFMAHAIADAIGRRQIRK